MNKYQVEITFKGASLIVPSQGANEEAALDLAKDIFALTMSRRASPKLVAQIGARVI